MVLGVSEASEGAECAKRAYRNEFQRRKMSCVKAVIETKKFHQKCLTNYTTTGIFDINF